MDKLDRLEDLASYKIFKRGVEYFESGAVSELEEDSPGEWTATVSGTDDYYVEISLEGNDITDWYCDCPYDGEGVCKHVIAVLLAIRETKKKSGKRSCLKQEHEDAEEPLVMEDVVTDDLPESEFQRQVFSLEQTELAKFILEYASVHPTLKEEFLNKFVLPKIIGPRRDFRAEVRKSFGLYCQRSRGRYRRSDFADRNWEATFGQLDNFLGEASLLLQYGNLDAVIAITLQILQSIGEEYDDELVYNDDLDVSGCCESAGNLLLEVIHHPKVSRKQKDEVLQELCQLVNLYPYKDYDVYDLEGLMQQVNILSQSQEGALSLINRLLVERKGSYGLYELVLQKVELLHKMDEQGKAEDAIREYLYLPEIRRREVDKLVVKSQYDEAIEMLDEGIRLAEKEENCGYQIFEWRKIKLQVYETANRTSGIREMSRRLFIDSNGSLEYYRKLKRIVPAEQWRTFLSLMMKETSFSCGFSWGRNSMADIYVEEEDYESLFGLLFSCAGREQLDGLMKYAHYLKDEYSEILITLFTSHLLDYAEKNLGRNHYEFVLHALSRMQQLHGGGVAVKRLLIEFRKKYKRRSAMMEILDKFTVVQSV